jgi:poly(A) polymerase
VTGHDPVGAVRAALPGGEAWLVGGTVRDELLGRPIRDVDLAVAGDPEPVARAVAKAVSGPVFPLSEAFGAWRAIGAGGAWVCDVSPLQGQTIEEDLGKRDFTVNSMAEPLAGGSLIDPYAGRRDLEQRLLRLVSDRAYHDDPLRPLRLARLAAELGFRAEPGTEEATRGAAPRVVEASPERIYAELRRLMVSDGALAGLDLADRTSLMRSVLPEVAELHDVEQSQFHHLDVYDHTMEVLAQAIELERSLENVFGELAPRLRAELDEPLADDLTRRQAIRFGALLHDIGKPRTRGVLENGRITFIGHDSVGEEMVLGLCRRLRTSDRFARFVAGLTRHHLVLGFLVHERPLAPRTVYRYLRTTSPVEVEVTLLSCADRLATRGKNAEPAIEAHLDLARELMAAALDWRASGPPSVPIRGDELARELGIEAGPELGALLSELAEAAYAGEAGDREEALEVARRLRHNRGE